MSSSSNAITDLLNDTWLIKKKVGKGSFSALYLAKNVVSTSFDDSQYVAIKIPIAEVESSVIKWEGDVIRGLNGCSNVPKFIHYGQQKGQDFLVMELLGGEDMASLRDRLRAKSPMISLPVANYLTGQILAGIKSLHMKGYIHRDIKPANFVRKSNLSTEFSVVDFGIAKQFVEKDGSLKPKRQIAEFRGTTLYASPFAHVKEDQCQRDDLYSMMFVFFDLICGKLPWTEEAKLKEKQKVADLKHQFVMADPSNIIQWVSTHVARIEENSPSSSSSSVAASTNFTARAQEKAMLILTYLQGLKYEDKPDYDFVELSLKQMLSDEQSLKHNVGNIKYDIDGFDWLGGVDTFKSIDEEVQKIDSNQHIKILCAKVKHLGKSILKSKKLHGEDLIMPWMDTSLALQWKALSAELCSINERKIDRETVELFNSVLKDAFSFTLIDIGANDADFDTYLTLNEFIYNFRRLYDKVIQRPQDFIVFGMKRDSSHI